MSFAHLKRKRLQDVTVCKNTRLKMPDSAMEEDLFGPEWLFGELRSQEGPNKLLILDCRAHADFSDAHIRGSVPLTIPSIMLRRLAAGKVDLLSTIRCLDLRNRVEMFLCGDVNRRGTFVLIGDSTDAGHQGETLQVLSRRLKSSGGNVAALIGEKREREQFLSHKLIHCNSIPIKIAQSSTFKCHKCLYLKLE